ncbi:MAG: hypothetical protein KGQ46_12325 [Hyphomicrobiales bacterium]|nr:hypothetical protein [Hyphomicrobiales bacterium]MDE2113854.1 hypothetical protein [Hyphomicrobiales bacterium]
MSNHDDLLVGISQLDTLSHKLAVLHHALDAVRRGSHELTGPGLRAFCAALEASVARAAHLEGQLAEARELAYPEPKPFGVVVSLFGGPIPSAAKLPVPPVRSIYGDPTSDGAA